MVSKRKPSQGPPAKVAKPKGAPAEAKAQAPAVVAKATGSAEGAVQVQIVGLNTDHLARMDTARDEVLACPHLEHIKSSMPLGIGHGGTKSTFKLADFKKAMDGEGHYECAGNWWWIKHTYQPVRNVHVNTRMVENDMQTKYSKPVSHLEHEIVVGVSKASVAHAKEPEYDSLERISASEFDDSFLLDARSYFCCQPLFLVAVLHTWSCIALSIVFLACASQ